MTLATAMLGRGTVVARRARTIAFVSGLSSNPPSSETADARSLADGRRFAPSGQHEIQDLQESIVVLGRTESGASTGEDSECGSMRGVEDVGDEHRCLHAHPQVRPDSLSVSTVALASVSLDRDAGTHKVPDHPDREQASGRSVAFDEELAEGKLVNPGSVAHRVSAQAGRW